MREHLSQVVAMRRAHVAFELLRDAQSAPTSTSLARVLFSRASSAVAAPRAATECAVQCDAQLFRFQSRRRVEK